MSDNRVFGVTLVVLLAAIGYFVYLVVSRSPAAVSVLQLPAGRAATPVAASSDAAMVQLSPTVAASPAAGSTPSPRSANGPTPAPSEFLTRDLSSVARVQTADAEGTAFLARQQGTTALWITNAHVVADTTSANLILTDGTNLQGVVVARDENVDIAVIAVENLTTLAALPIGNADALTTGDSLYVIGYPLGQELVGLPSVSRGIVSGTRTFRRTAYIQTDAAINHGNSGGPVLDATGAVVGIATSRISGFGTVQGINFALPSSVIVIALDNLGTVSSAALSPGGIWVNLSTVNEPITRYHDTVVWTGTEMIVWGGLGTKGFPGDGARYNPESGTWKAMSLVGAPSPRSLNAGVWTGTDLVVWGGTHSTSRSGFLADGARYNPKTDRWTALPPSPLAPRIGAEAVWTGHDVIIWGGTGGTDARPVYFGDGARYTPSTNTWSMLPTTNAPTPRWQHTLVWTGTQAIVWGGYDGEGDTGFVDDGGIFTPSSNSWTPIHASPAMSARANHSAVWTGHEMIVWGGEGDDGVLRDGGRFNPSAGSWISLPDGLAPSARADHAAIWTGQRMVVFGGVDDVGVPLWSGALYDPAINSWRPLPMAPTPARAEPKAVWTGSQVIVWGGLDGPIPTGRSSSAPRQPTPVAVAAHGAGLSLVLQN